MSEERIICYDHKVDPEEVPTYWLKDHCPDCLRARLSDAEAKACKHVHLSSDKEDPDIVDLKAELAAKDGVIADHARRLGEMEKDIEPIPSVENPCSKCGVLIYGSYIGTGDGTMKDGGSFAHPECYYRSRCAALESELTAMRGERDEAQKKLKWCEENRGHL